MKTESKLGITKAKLYAVEYSGFWNIQDEEGYTDKSDVLNAERVGETEAKANAELFVDAHTTANACGLLPSELLKQKEELLAALQTCYNWAKNGEQETLIVFEQALEAIKKATT